MAAENPNTPEADQGDMNWPPFACLVPLDAPSATVTLAEAKKLELDTQKVDEGIKVLRRAEWKRATFWIGSVTPIAALLALFAQVWWATARQDRAQAELISRQADIVNSQAKSLFEKAEWT